MSKISKNPVKLLRYGNHGEAMATALASNLRHSAFADVKIICADGSAWAHRLVLAAVSPVLRHVFLTNFIMTMQTFLYREFVKLFQAVVTNMLLPFSLTLK